MEPRNYMLIDVARKHVWTGSGFVRIPDVDKDTPIVWMTREEALAEKKALKAQGIHLRISK